MPTWALLGKQNTNSSTCASSLSSFSPLHPLLGVSSFRKYRLSSISVSSHTPTQTDFCHFYCHASCSIHLPNCTLGFFLKEFHTMYFDHIHPNSSPKLLPGPPHPFISVSFFSSFHQRINFKFCYHILLAMGLSLRAWWTYQEPHP